MFLQQLFCLAGSLLLLLFSVYTTPALCARDAGFILLRSHPQDGPPRTKFGTTGLNAFVRTPETHIQTPTFLHSIMLKPTSLDNEDLVSRRPKTSNDSNGSSKRSSSTPHLRTSRSTLRIMRRLLSNSLSKSDPSLDNEEDLIMTLAGFKATKDHNLFGMLPRARVPPSGPSKNHNSALTEKSS